MNYGTHIAIISIVAACSTEPAPKKVALSVEVRDGNGRPVRGAAVEVDGEPRGETDQVGVVKTLLRGPDGRRAEVRIACPEGWVARKGDTLIIPVRFLKRIGEGSDLLVPIAALMRCDPARLTSVLLVRTNGMADLPVISLGRMIAVTDSDGVAQAVISGFPGEEIEVVLDTSKHPELRPSTPSRRITVPDSSQIFVFDQTFKAVSKRNRRPRRKAKSGPKRI